MLLMIVPQKLKSVSQESYPLNIVKSTYENRFYIVKITLFSLIIELVIIYSF